MAKITGKYEVLYIIDPTLGEEGTAALVEKFKAMVEAEGTDVLFFMLQEPVPVVVHADAPEKIDGLRGEAGKHEITSCVIFFR